MEAGMTNDDDQVREVVRERYAAAARAVTGSGTESLALLDERDQCCGPAPAADAAQTSSGCCGPGADVGSSFGSELYDIDEQDAVPAEALLASLGCGNPTAVADLGPGDRVLDLG